MTPDQPQVIKIFTFPLQRFAKLCSNPVLQGFKGSFQQMLSILRSYLHTTYVTKGWLSNFHFRIMGLGLHKLNWTCFQKNLIDQRPTSSAVIICSSATRKVDSKIPNFVTCPIWIWPILNKRNLGFHSDYCYLERGWCKTTPLTRKMYFQQRHK